MYHKQIIRDERYAGHMVGHKKVYESFGSKRQVGVDKSQWIVVRNTHEGIVTQEEFDRANANMRDVVQEKKKNPSTKKNFSVIVCLYCGLTLRPRKRQDGFMYCPTGRMYRDSPCSEVRIRKDVAEQTLVELVRTQAQLLVTAEQMLKEKKSKPKKGRDAGNMRAETRRLEEAKVSDYESYKEGKLTREMFLEREKASELRRQELSAAAAELEAQELVEDDSQRKYGEVFGIKEYLHLEQFDKAVMAFLIESAKVMGEDRLEVTWKHQDVYEKILGEMQG